jgi:hypothetical protein
MDKNYTLFQLFTADNEFRDEDLVLLDLDDETDLVDFPGPSDKTIRFLLDYDLSLELIPTRQSGHQSFFRN